MVEPTKRKPRFFRSLLIASDAGVEAGTCDRDFHRVTFGGGSTDHQLHSSKRPSSFCTVRKAAALVTADSILSRLRTIPGSFISFAISFRPNRETACGSNRAKALR